jgi:serine/threonine-protein kinase HipA
LYVQVGKHLVGVLSHDPESNRFAFDYADSWLGPLSFALGPTLPLRGGDDSPDSMSSRVRLFFENLLPEGQALEDVARAQGISKKSLPGLLAVLGRETAGALRITTAAPGDAQAADAVAVDSERLREVTREELSTRLRARPEIPFSVWDGRVRLSIAGHQDKLAVMQVDGRWFLVDDPLLASTHILKPPPPRATLYSLPYNEFTCMRLAALVGLPCAAVELVHTPEPVLVVERFDRRRIGAAVERLHIIDGCQALGLPVEHKYERPYGHSKDVAHQRVGASLDRFFDLVDGFNQPAAAKLTLLRWAIFQILVGNFDAHAKNLSFHCDAFGMSLAPAYDIVCTLVYGEAFDQTLSMGIGDAFDPADLGAFDWAFFAHRCGLERGLVPRELGSMTARVAKHLPEAIASARAAGAPESLLGALRDAIAGQCAKQALIAPMVAQVDPSILDPDPPHP